MSTVKKGRSPHGERGLKFIGAAHVHPVLGSLPTRGAWIEITKYKTLGFFWTVAPHTGSVD